VFGDNCVSRLSFVFIMVMSKKRMVLSVSSSIVNFIVGIMSLNCACTPFMLVPLPHTFNVKNTTHLIADPKEIKVNPDLNFPPLT
jgi:hypothetical protein